MSLGYVKLLPIFLDLWIFEGFERSAIALEMKLLDGLHDDCCVFGSRSSLGF